MADGLDEGDVIATRTFDPPELEFGNIPELYSVHMRSELLLDVIKDYAARGEFRASPQDPNAGVTYHLMHPVLSNAVFWKCRLAADQARERAMSAGPI
jgi:hypothetical protein